jgi:hypothetical protein
MREGVKSSRRGWVAIWALAVLVPTSLVLGSCSVTPGGPAAPDPGMSVWMTGDSNAGATAATMSPRPYSVAAGGAGFTSYSSKSIQGETQDRIDANAAPETLLVIGGVIDAVRATSAEIIAAMSDFESDMTAQGVRVVWVAEPAWTLAAEVAPLSAWILTRPDHIDCRASAGGTYDGVHPVDFKPFAACVNLEAAALGVTFVDLTP